MIVSNWDFSYPLAIFLLTGTITVDLIIASVSYNRQLPFIATGIIWILSGFILLINVKKKLENIKVDLGLFLVMASIALYSNLVFVRIYNESQFSSTFNNMDFGPKPNSTEHSYAFDNIESIGHVCWGFLIIPFFGVVKLNGVIKTLVNELLGMGLVVYPVYNFIKRVLKSHEDFSRSSYFNNQFEWVYGTYIGILISILIVNTRKQHMINEISYVFRIIIGIFMMLSVFAAYIMTIATWGTNEYLTPIMGLCFPGLLVYYIIHANYFRNIEKIDNVDGVFAV